MLIRPVGYNHGEDYGVFQQGAFFKRKAYWFFLNYTIFMVRQENGLR